MSLASGRLHAHVPGGVMRLAAVGVSLATGVAAGTVVLDHASWWTGTGR